MAWIPISAKARLLKNKEKKCHSCSWQIVMSICEDSWFYPKWFRSYGLNTNFSQSQTTHKWRKRCHSCSWYIVSMWYTHLWSFVNLSHKVKDLWPGHQFYPRADNSYTVRVVKIVCNTLAQYDIPIFKDSGIYPIRFKSPGLDTNLSQGQITHK